MDAVDEVAHHEAVKTPLVAEDIGEQLFTRATVVAVKFVIRAHDGLSACVDALLEVRQIDFVQRAVVAPDVDEEAQILDAVAGKVLRAGDHAFLLHGSGQRRAIFAQQKWIFAVALLRATPFGVAHQIDADARKVVGALSDGLFRNGLAEAVFQLRIKGGGAQHGHWEAGGVAHHDAARPIGKEHRRYAQPLTTARPEGRDVIIAPGLDHIPLRLADGMSGEHIDLFLLGHLAAQSCDLPV